MSRLEIETDSRAQATIDRLLRDMQRRLASSPPGKCPVDFARNFLTLCHAQTCGKCSPCRVGLARLNDMLGEVLDGEPDAGILETIEQTARVIADTADCAIGVEAARMILVGLAGFRDDYQAHIETGACKEAKANAVSCVADCPAHVDIPGYIALIRAGKHADAVRLIRKDNPFPAACGYICEHPCESRCRRGMVDAPINIRGLKRYAVDNSADVPHPKCGPPTGKKVAVVGGGPGGLTAAYYLALMGHSVTVFEKRAKLGGMMRYGIPEYRFPRHIIDAEIASILTLGIDVKLGVDFGVDVKFADARKEYDAIFFSIGAHTDKKLRIDGEDAEGVISAVEMLRAVGDGHAPNFKGKNVIIVGGGNVAMDCART
ncbi:MAG: FAD-dependent oxidoreductase, partial [Thermoguttaceae bacterium]|nr:FAD-dependent oxidoreductase [Thermoguttaceae bacterium]